MRLFLSYFRLSAKKNFKSLLAIFLSVLLLVCVLAVVAQTMVNADRDDISRQKIKIGIAGDTEGTHLGLGFSAISEADDIGFSVEFLEMEQEEAETALIDARISAYVLVPDDYVASLVRGEDAVLTFVMSRSSADLSAILMSEVAQVLSPLVTDSESGIYAMMDYGYDNDGDGISEKVTRLNLKYIMEIMDRSDALDKEILGVDSLNMKEYYVCGVVTFFLLIFSVTCCPVFADKHLPMGCRLLSVGVKTWQIILCEYIAYFLVMFVSVVFLAVGGGVVCSMVDVGIDPAWVYGLPRSLMPCLVMISALHFAVYEMMSGLISGVLAQFVLAVATGYVSGCFYPYYMFPTAIQKVSSYLPSGITFEFIKENMAMRQSNVWLVCLLYAAAFLLLSVAVRRIRLSEETA